MALLIKSSPVNPAWNEPLFVTPPLNNPKIFLKNYCLYLTLLPAIMKMWTSFFSSLHVYSATEAAMQFDPVIIPAYP